MGAHWANKLGDNSFSLRTVWHKLYSERHLSPLWSSHLGNNKNHKKFTTKTFLWAAHQNNFSQKKNNAYGYIGNYTNKPATNHTLTHTTHAHWHMLYAQVASSRRLCVTYFSCVQNGVLITAAECGWLHEAQPRFMFACRSIALAVAATQEHALLEPFHAPGEDHTKLCAYSHITGGGDGVPIAHANTCKCTSI